MRLLSFLLFLISFFPFLSCASEPQKTGADYFFFGLGTSWATTTHSLDVTETLKCQNRSASSKENLKKNVSDWGIGGVLGWMTQVNTLFLGVELQGGRSPSSEHKLHTSYLNNLIQLNSTIKYSQSETGIRVLVGYPIQDKTAAFLALGPTLCFNDISMSGDKGNVTYKYESKNTTGFAVGTFVQQEVRRVRIRLGYNFSYVPSFSTEVTGSYYPAGFVDPIDTKYDIKVASQKVHAINLTLVYCF